MCSALMSVSTFDSIILHLRGRLHSQCLHTPWLYGSLKNRQLSLQRKQGDSDDCLKVRAVIPSTNNDGGRPFEGMVEYIIYTRLSCRRRCLVQPEVELSSTVGDGDFLYGRRWRCLVWPETEISCMAGDCDDSYGRRR